MRNANEILSVIAGIFIAFGLNALAVVLLYLGISISSSVSSLLGLMFVFAIAGIGIFQVVYILPYAMKLKRDGKIAAMKGVIIGAVIVALLNGTCWLLFPIKLV